MSFSIHQCVYTGKFTATLLGGEFDNCHGYGYSEETAIMSLKLTLKVRRKKRDQNQIQSQ